MNNLSYTEILDKEKDDNKKFSDMCNRLNLYFNQIKDLSDQAEAAANSRFGAPDKLKTFLDDIDSSLWKVKRILKLNGLYESTIQMKNFYKTFSYYNDKSKVLHNKHDENIYNKIYKKFN